jgi:hypothetical protein
MGSGAIDSAARSPSSARIVAITDSASAGGVIAALEHGADRGVRVLCEVADVAGHTREVGGLKPTAAERVGAVRIKAGRDENELRTEIGCRGHHHVLEQRQP